MNKASRDRKTLLQEENAALKTALRIGSHDLRGSLLAITFLSSLAATEPDEAMRREYRMQIQETCDVATALLDTYFDVVVAESLTIRQETVDLAALIKQAMASQLARLSPVRRTRFDVQLTLESIVWPADSLRLGQVVSNLIGNVFGHCLEGGVVKISLCRQEGGVLLSIIDQGPGIAAARLSTLFDLPADSCSLRGLGLWLCKRIVEAHGGSISCSSIVGQGSDFRLTLPAQAQ